MSKNKGQFTKGNSGNPTGRPAGSRNQDTLAYEQLLQAAGPQLMQVLVDQAQAGHFPALRLALERIYPLRREQAVALPMRPIEGPQDLPQAFQELATALADGRITAAEGEARAHILKMHANVLETVAYDRRLLALEARDSDVQAYQHELDNFKGSHNRPNPRKDAPQ
jgi:Family of unknown function (DUF5681)